MKLPFSLCLLAAVLPMVSPSLLHAGSDAPVAADASASAGMAERIATYFGMKTIPHEGPLFVQRYRGDPLVGGELAARYPEPHAVYTSIYGIMTPERFSALHRLATDELWHFYGGDPIEMLLLHPDGRGETVILGSDVLAGQHALFCVPAGTWQGSRLLEAAPDAYALAGNTLAPGFEYSDYEPGYREELISAYPAWAEMITALTREDSLRRPAPLPSTKPATKAAPVVLTPKVGRGAPVESDAQSVAHVRVAAGFRSPAGYLRTGAETLLVTAGQGELVVDGAVTRLRAGDVVMLPPGKPHVIQASAGVPVEAYAICTPAFDPSDYVEVEPARPLSP